MNNLYDLLNARKEILILISSIFIGVAFTILLQSSSYKIIFIGISIFLLLIAVKKPIINYLLISSLIILISPEFGDQQQTEVIAGYLYDNLSTVIKISPMELWLFVSTGCLLLTNNIPILPNKISKAMVIFFAITTLGLLLGIINGNFNDGLREFRPILFLFMSFLYTLLIFRRAKDSTQKRIFSILFVVISIKAIQGLFLFFILRSGYWYKGFLRVFGGVELLFSLWFVIFAIMMISFGYKIKLIGLFALIVNFLIWVFSFSRSIWIAGIIAILSSVILLSYVQKKSLKSLGLLVVIVVILLGILMVSGGLGYQIVDYLSTINPMSEEATNRFRIFESQVAFNHIKQNPILGYGLGYEVSDPVSMSLEWSEVEVQPSLVHNTYLWIWLKMGIFGLLSFASLFTTSLLISITKIRKMTVFEKIVVLSAVSSVIGLIFVLITGNWLLNIRVVFFLGLLFGLIASICEKRQLVREA